MMLNDKTDTKTEEDKIFKLKNRLIGDAFEFGFYIGLASQDSIPVFKGIAINEPPYQERGGEQELKEFLEKATKTPYSDIINRLIKRTSKIQGIPIFEIYRMKIQKSRTKKEESIKVSELLKQDDRTAHDILRVTKTGFQCSLAIINFIQHKWGQFSPMLEILVEPTLVSKRPDFIIVFNPSAQKPSTRRKKSSIQNENLRILAIGDVKSFYEFIFWSREKFLSEYIDQLLIDEFSINNLHNFNLIKDKTVSFADFHKITGILSKYLKILQYCKLYYSNLQTKETSIVLFIIFPSAISTINVNSHTHLNEILNFLKLLIPKNIRVKDKNPLILDEITRSHLFDLLYEGNVYIQKKNINSKTIYEITGKAKEEIEYIFGERTQYIETYEKPVKVKPAVVHSDEIVSNISNVREQHKTDFIEALQNEEIDIIINGSEQGIGKNHTLIEYLISLASSNQKFKIVYFCPRVITILQTKRIIETRLKEISNPNIEVKQTLSERELTLYLDRTYKHIEIVHKRAGEKLAEELRKETNQIILVTSQTLTAFVRNPSNRLLLFSRANMLVFDELIGSEPITRCIFIDLLRLANDYITTNDIITPPKIVVMDASITSSHLFQRMLELLIQNKKQWYWSFTCTYRNETDKKREWKTDNLSVFFLRHTIKFNLEYAAGSQIIESKYMNKDCIKQIIPALETLVHESSFNKEFAELLHQGKVIFYIDNKKMVDVIIEQLKENKFDAIPMTSDTPRFAEIPIANIVGTSSLAFGTNFPHQELLIILPPSISQKSYFETTKNVQLFRQVAKRMRGGETNDISKNRMIVFFSLLPENSSITNQRINFFLLRGFIKNHLVNDNYHVLTTFSRSVKARFGSVMSLYGVKAKQPSRIVTVTLDDFLKEYYPSIRNALNHFHMYIQLRYLLEFDTTGQWENIPVPLFLFYKISKQQIAQYFSIEVYHDKQANFDDLVGYLLKPTYLYSVEKGLKLLEMIVKSRYPKTKPDERSKSFPYLLSFILFGKKNIWSLTRRIKELLTPTLMQASNSFLLATIDLTEDIMMGDDYEKENLRRLRSVGSPLGTVYFGDMNLFEEPMRVLMTSKDSSYMTYGFIISYPKFGTNTSHIKSLIGNALGHEMIREDTLILPRIVKYLLAEGEYGN